MCGGSAEGFDVDQGFTGRVVGYRERFGAVSFFSWQKIFPTLASSSAATVVSGKRKLLPFVEGMGSVMKL